MPAWHVGFCMAAALLAGSLAASSQAESEQPDCDAVCDALDSGVEQWRASVEFRCHYSYRQGSAKTREAALRGAFGSEAGRADKEEKATGVFCKRGDEIRLSMDFGRPPHVWTSKSGVTTATNFSFDEVSSRDLFLTYNPPYEDSVGSAMFSERPDRKSGKLWSGPYMQGQLNPFSFGGGIEGSPIRSFAKDFGGGDAIERSYEKVDAERIVVTLIRTSRSGQVTKRMTFWTGASPPVIERVDTMSRSMQPDRQSESTAIASRFVQCGGGMMARCVRTASGPVVPVGGSEPLWIAKEWISDDLGDKPPGDEDFIVTIPASVPVGGLKHPPSRGQVRHLDLAKVRPEDLVTDFSQPVGEQPAPPETVVPSWVRYTLAVLSAVVLTFLVLVIRRARRRAAAC